MKQIVLHAVTSVLTVAVWTILSGDLGQAAGVTILYWMIFWAVAEIEERWKMIWIEGENAENEQRMVDAKKTEEVVEESKRLLSSSDWFEVAVGSGMREALKKLELW